MWSSSSLSTANQFSLVLGLKRHLHDVVSTISNQVDVQTIKVGVVFVGVESLEVYLVEAEHDVAVYVDINPAVVGLEGVGVFPPSRRQPPLFFVQFQTLSNVSRSSDHTARSIAYPWPSEVVMPPSSRLTTRPSCT